MPAAERATAIEFRGVSKHYGNPDQPVVDRLDLTIHTGELVALVGPSGCGKTTTLKMINRLIEPSAGEIDVLGRDQAVQPAHELRRQIGYVIQHVGLFPHRTIGGNIGVVCELLGWPKRAIAERAAELTELVGLERDVLDRYPAELSGGQQQRVGVARALAADPPILLMDEPYSAVDPIVRERLQDDLLALQAQVRKTIVFVTHDIDEAIRLADRVAVMAVGGVLAQFDTPDGLLAAPATPFVRAFLGRERGLRRLALLTVGDVDPARGPVVGPAVTAAEALTVMDRERTTWVAVVDGHRLLGWISQSGAAALEPGSAVTGAAVEPFVARVRPGTPLREALDVVVTSRSRIAAVVDDDDRFHGMITVDEIAGGLEA